MLFKKITFTCSKQLNDERSISAIYHLLTGKRSIQTVQDAHNYQLTPFFGILPSIDKQTYDENINKYITDRYITTSGDQQIIQITSRGRQWLDNHQSVCVSGFNGMTYAGMDIIFFQRLLLLVQMITNSKRNNYTYIPIVDQKSITNWAKQLYQKIHEQIDQASEVLYEEISTILHQLTTHEASMFVDRLTGYKTFGLSINQLANKYNEKPIDVVLIFTQISHQMIRLIIEQKQKYQLLAIVLDQLQTEKFLTQSAYQTYKLINKGFHVPQIAKMRSLKENTIYDHLVEISLYDENFPFQQYISDHTYKEIISIVEMYNSFKLKDIKQRVNDHISYFQIRLALAKRSQEKGSHVL